MYYLETRVSQFPLGAASSSSVLAAAPSLPDEGSRGKKARKKIGYLLPGCCPREAELKSDHLVFVSLKQHDDFTTEAKFWASGEVLQENILLTEAVGGSDASWRAIVEIAITGDVIKRIRLILIEYGMHGWVQARGAGKRKHEEIISSS